MSSYINVAREEWVNAEYNFDIPAVVILIPRRIGIMEFLKDTREPEKLCGVITELIERKYPILKGCVICSFSLDRYQDSWSCYVVHNSLKRVSLMNRAPIVRMREDNEDVLLSEGEQLELPIRDEIMRTEIVITDNKGPKFEEKLMPDVPLIFSTE